MPRYSGDDPYLDPHLGVLKNKFGIEDANLLESAETDLAASRSMRLLEEPIQGAFDLTHLCKIHGYLFGDLYEWAGQLRTVDISKNDNHFAHHTYLVTAAEAIFDKLAAERRLHGLDGENFCSRAAYFLGEINALHPFREGNGRAQREFISQLARANGFHIAWEDVDREELLQASIESFKGNLTRLTAILRANLVSLREQSDL